MVVDTGVVVGVGDIAVVVFAAAAAGVVVAPVDLHWFPWFEHVLELAAEQGVAATGTDAVTWLDNLSVNIPKLLFSCCVAATVSFVRDCELR